MPWENNTVIVPGTCMDCRTEYRVEVPFNVCGDCFRAKYQPAMEAKAKEMLMKHINELRQKKPSRMKRFKQFTYWVLLLVPLSTFLGCKFGTVAQHCFDAGIIAAPIIAFLAEWLNEKF